MKRHAYLMYQKVSVLCAAVALLTTICFPSHALAQAWPTIRLPKNIVTVPVGEQITQNGLPMRIQAFATKQSSAELAAWFRESFGPRHVENKLAHNSIVIGRAEGDFYLSVQLTPTASGTRGIVAVSRIKAIEEASAKADGLKLTAPGNSKVLSDTRSEDSGKIGRHLIYTNQSSLEENNALVSTFLKDRGYKLERETSTENKTGQTLFFRDGDREAIAVIARQGDKTAVVVNMTSHDKQRQ